MTLIKQTNTIFSKLFLTIFVSFSIFNAIFAADGDLDLSFNGTGKVITDIGDHLDASWASAMQSDGKIVTVGTSGDDQHSWNGRGFAVARYNADGSIDKSFDFDGKIYIPKHYGKAIAVAIQTDGKIVFVGHYLTNGDGWRSVVIRLNTDGSFDSTFGGVGSAGSIVLDNFKSNAMVLQENGKIVVGGYSSRIWNNETFYDITLMRINGDGTLDSSFGAGGIAVRTTPYVSDWAYSIAIQQDNKIVAYTYRGLFRFNGDGTVDSSFGVDGSVPTPFSYLWEGEHIVKIQSDGKIVVNVITGYAAGVYSHAIFRYNMDGTLDSTFDGDGVALISPNFGGIGSFSIQSDGKIVIGTFANRFSLVRLNPDGSLDEKFGEGGIYSYPLNPSSGYIGRLSIILQSDDKIVSTRRQGNEPGGDFDIVRNNSDGSLDATFGSGGIVTTGDFAGKSGINSIAIQGDGKIVAVGGHFARFLSGNGVFSKFDIARYNVDGTLDSSFSTDGKVNTELGRVTYSWGSYGSAVAVSVAIQADRKIVVSGICDTFVDGSYRTFFAIVRYNPNGSIDSSFGQGGKILLPVAVNGTPPELRSSLIQPDGKIVVSGIIGGAVMLARFTSNGQLDTSFGTNGILIDSSLTPLPNPFNGYNLSIQPDGKFLISGGGDWIITTPFSFKIARYNSDGSKDMSFGVDGIATSSCKAECFLNDVKVQSDGKIVGVGFFGNDFAATRFNPDGTSDTTFNGTGKITTSFEGKSLAKRVAIQADGKIIASGISEYDGSRAVRYNPDGSLDSSFGIGGKLTIQFEGLVSSFTSLLIQRNGKIVFAGKAGQTFGLARYEGTLVAENATIGGRISTASGRAIRNVTLQISGGNLTQPKIARTNSFGYYRFQDLEVGQIYVVSIAAKRYTFANPSRVITLNENLDGEDFVSEGK
jgi:uncharacterized delta-60 repeat protein